MTLKKQIADRLNNNELTLKALLKLYKASEASSATIIRIALQESVKITNSQIGFIGLIDKKETIMHTHVWSRKAMKDCRIDYKPVEFSIKGAGIWAEEAVRKRKSIIMNDYSMPHAGKKGLPKGHAAFKRIISIPVISNSHVAVVGSFANKKDEYNENDILQASLLLECLWGIIKNRRAVEELSQSEKKYRYLVENLHEGIWVIDKDARTVFVNPRLMDMLGYTRDEMIGKHLFDFIDKSWIENGKANIKRRQKGIKEQHDFEFVKKDGSRIYTTMVTSPIYDDKEKYSGAIAGVIDITESKKTEGEIKQLNKHIMRLLEEERQKVSEDLHDGIGQTILAAKINIETYKNNPEKNNERLIMGLQFIDKSSKEIKEICMSLYPRMLSDLGLPAAIRWYAKNTLEVAGIKTSIRVKIQKKLSHDIEINIYRIIQEIFSNIIKHSKATKATLNLHIKEQLGLTIKDNGIGFNAEKVKNCNMGQGLFNIRHRVESIGGTCAINSMPGKGFKFTIKADVNGHNK